jgi:trimeric autotransporter adhesin
LRPSKHKQTLREVFPMMRSYKGSLILGAVICVSAGSAYAQQPPDIVQSDSSYNTAMGHNADAAGGGEANTAVGQSALERGGGGGFNTAVGGFAIWLNGIGDGNSALGYDALGNNDSGFQNTAAGLRSMLGNISGYWNTASGVNSLAGNNTGHSNTGAGVNALCGNATGNENTATGAFALTGGSFTIPRGLTRCAIGIGDDNSALGAYALNANTSGSYNTASGAGALRWNTSGANNTALGVGALQSNTIGANNIAVGYYAGSNITIGYRNIDIANTGAKGDAGTIRIGTSSEHFATYIAGISGAHLTGSAVYISSTGQLGVLASSERYKTAIEPMAQRTEKLAQLRPVTFHLKTDPKGAIQYGLIAEEVAKVYPELAIRDDAGTIQGVRYEELAPMLLNEAQEQRQEIGQLKQQLEQLRAALLKLQAKDALVAQR